MKVNKPDIVFVIPSIQYGGAELQVLRQTEFFLNDGYNAHLLITSSAINKDLLAQYNIPSENIFCLNGNGAILSFRNIIKSLKNIPAAVRYFNKVEADVVVANLPLVHFICRLSKMFSKKKFKLVIYHRSLQYDASPMDTFGKKVFNKIHYWLAKQTDNQSICISNAVLDNIKVNFHLTRPTVIYNAVAETNVTADAATAYLNNNGVTRKPFFIVIPGRLNKVKGHLFFLTTFLRYITLNEALAKNIMIVFVGGGTLEKEIRAFLNANKLDSYVHLTGSVENGLMRSFMAAADLVLIPSLFEGLGNVAIEALMAKNLVLSSDAGGLKEIIADGRNGYLFKAGDQDDLLQKLEYVIANYSDLPIDKNEVYKSFTDRFSLQEHMQKLQTVLCSND